MRQFAPAGALFLSSWAVASCASSAPPSADGVRASATITTGALAPSSAPDSTARSAACVDAEERTLRDALAARPHGGIVVSRDGAFAVRLAPDAALVFALDHDPPVLAAVVPGEGTPSFDGHRLLVQQERAIDWVDLDAKTAGTISDAMVFAIRENVRLVAGRRSLRRFDAQWKLRGEMTLDFDVAPKAIELDWIGGKYVRAGDTLVRLEDHAVVVRAHLRSVDRKVRRAIHCTDQGELVATELDTGREIVRLGQQEASCSFSVPVLADDARAVVWFTGNDGGGAIVHVVDVATKRETTTVDRAAFFGGLWTAASTHPDDDRKVCLSVAGKSWARDECHWIVSNGRARRAPTATKPAPPAVPWGQRLKLDGTELTSVEDGATGRVAVATFLPVSGPFPRGRQLVVHVADRETKSVTRSVVVREEPFPFDWETNGMGTPPALAFAGPDRVVFYAGQPSALPNVVIDVGTGTATRVESDDVSKTDAPHVLQMGRGRLFDARRGNAVELGVAVGAYRAALRVRDGCE